MGEETILVTIGKPEPVEGEGDYCCRYKIEGAGKKKTSYAIGLDAVQALQLTMKKIGVDLEAHARKRGIPVSWLGDTPGKTGFSE